MPISAVLSSFPPRDRIFSDPYPYYHQLRSKDPVHWSQALGAWIVSRYDDTAAGLRDARLSAVRLPALVANAPIKDDIRRMIIQRGATQMINSDPPEHARRRNLVSNSFAPRRIEALRPRIQQVVDRLIDRAVGAGQMDVVRDFAYSVPMTVLAEILGIPIEDGERIKAWAGEVAGLLAGGRIDKREIHAYLHGWGELASYFRELSRDRPISNTEDVITLLVRRAEAAETDEDEMLSNLVLLAVAGHETTTNMIATGLLTILLHTEQHARLQADPSLMPGAVEEILRHDPTSQWDLRLALADLEIRGREIRAGQLVNFLLGAANRDPDRFPDPDQFDPTRSPNRHLAFGLGIHFCLGAQLARLELEVAIGTMLRRLRAITLVDPTPEWKDNLRLRGLRSLRVTFMPR